MSLSARTIKAAREVWAIVVGEHKAEMLRTLLEGEPEETAAFPARYIDACQGDVVWFIDEAAASLLSSS